MKLGLLGSYNNKVVDQGLKSVSAIQFSKYLWNTYYVPGTILDTGYTTMSNQTKIPVLMEFIV